MYSLLIVDDEPAIRKGLKILVDYTALGYRIVGEAASGAEAAELIEALNPDVVITDIKMPGMDGLELIRKTDGEVPLFIILSGHSEFELARQAIRSGALNYLVKPIDEEELEEALREAASHLQSRCSRISEAAQAVMQRLFIRILQNQGTDRDWREFEQSLSLKGENLFCLYGAVQNSRGLTPGELAARLQDGVSDLFSGAPLLWSALGQDRFFFLLTETQLKRWNGQGMGFGHALLHRTSEHFDMALALGKRVRRVADLPAAYATALAASEHSVYRDLNSWVDYREIQGIQFQKKYTPLAETNHLIHAVTGGTVTDVEDCCRDLVDQFREQYLTASVIGMHLNALVTRIAGMLEDRSIDTSPLNIQDFLSACQGDRIILSLLEGALIRFLSAAHELFECRQKGEGKGIIGDVEEVIRTRYREPLTLKQIAAELNANPNYLGQIFKKKTGRSFNGYLRNLRIEQAKSLLLTTDLLVYEIADQVGFKEASYFLTCFEEQEGMSPGQYRRKQG